MPETQPTKQPKWQALQRASWGASIARSLSTTQWATLGAGIVSVTWGVWAWVTQWGYLPAATFALVAFTCTILLANGLISLRTRRRPLRETMEFDYSYGLSFEEIHIGIDAGKPEAFFQVAIKLRNATDAPLRYHVDTMHVVVADRTVENPQFLNRDGVIPRGGSTLFFYPAFPKATLAGLPSRLAGRIEYAIKYGHPEVGYVRLAKKVLGTSYRLDDKPGAMTLIVSESDEPIGGTSR
jgi:hypothetical protein